MERMALLDLLANQTGAYDFLFNLRKTREAIDFSQNEMLKMDIRTVNGKVLYDTKTVKKLGKDIGLSDWAIQVIGNRLQELSNAGKLRESDMSLYEKFVQPEPYLPEQKDSIARELRELRKGKKSVAIVGFDTASCSLAPYKDNVELWGLNEAHAFNWMTRATRWFQVHDSYKREVAKRGIKHHYDWLKRNEWNIPIYMMKGDPLVPNSIAYPFDEVCDKFLGGIRKGEDRVRYFGSTFDYMMGIALLEGFERIEIYGIGMDSDNEYANQKPSAEFWIGIALGLGIEVYLTPESKLLKESIYGGLENIV